MFDFQESIDKAYQVLAMHLSENSADDELELFILHSTFIINKFKLDIKNHIERFTLIEYSTKPLEKIELIWNHLNKNSREEDENPSIILTDNGVYMESQFFSFIPNSSTHL